VLLGLLCDKRYDSLNEGVRGEKNMLRSINALRGYSIRATDDEIGQVDDFLFDDQAWVIRYIVAGTGHWLAKQKVLVLPAKLESIDEDANVLTVTITRQQIEKSPPLAADKPVSRQKEAELHRYYGEPAIGL
jgi:uncharacterized protein YrrD